MPSTETIRNCYQYCSFTGKEHLLWTLYDLIMYDVYETLTLMFCYKSLFYSLISSVQSAPWSALVWCIKWSTQIRVIFWLIWYIKFRVWIMENNFNLANYIYLRYKSNSNIMFKIIWCLCLLEQTNTIKQAKMGSSRL